MSEPMDACPFSKKGHALSCLVPFEADLPAILYCERCGSTKPVSLRLPAPLDDLTAADIAAITERR